MKTSWKIANLRYSCYYDRAARCARRIKRAIHPPHYVLRAPDEEGLRSGARHLKSRQRGWCCWVNITPRRQFHLRRHGSHGLGLVHTRFMLVNGQGNFGSMDGDPPAAIRYTEAKMARLADELLADIDKKSRGFRDNCDGTTRSQPSCQPNCRSFF